MTKRIKLDEDDLLTMKDGLQGLGAPSMKDSRLYEIWKYFPLQQIIDDQDIVSNLGVNPRQLIQEWKKKAEKWDKRDSDRTNLLTESNTKYRQENKQLKEEHKKALQLANEDMQGVWRQYDNLKQKLEKIEEYVVNYEVPEHGYPWHIEITKILKEKE